jgi:hypothetical protein
VEIEIDCDMISDKQCGTIEVSDHSATNNQLMDRRSDEEILFNNFVETKQHEVRKLLNV